MNKWQTVTKQSPCPVCGKPDWCGVHRDGAVRCMRVPSDKPSNGGWIHGGNKLIKKLYCRTQQHKQDKELSFDAALWWGAVRAVTATEAIELWAKRLGLPAWTLDHMGACIHNQALCFPMRDECGMICGIRTRLKNGRKLAIRGSKAGVMVPTFHDESMPPLIVEGPSDACAALALGFEPIARPSCTGSEMHVINTCRRYEYDRITICADKDTPGIAGANSLARSLRASRIMVRMVTPGQHNDLRDFWIADGNVDALMCQWKEQAYLGVTA